MSKSWEPPYLRDLVENLKYKNRWEFSLQYKFLPTGIDGLVFQVFAYVENAFDHTEKMVIPHNFPVPPVSYNRDNWAAWIVDRIGDVERHERDEAVQFYGVREFAPHHSNGEDPYRTWHTSDYATARKACGDD